MQQLRLITLALILGTCAACTGEKCETKTVKAGTCEIEVKECACEFFPNMKYKATAKDKASGKSEDADWSEDKDKPYEEAVYDLFKKDLEHDPSKPDQADYCNCQHQDQKVGTCTIRATVCGYFESTGDVKKEKISYQAWATDLASKKVAHVDGQSDPTKAGTAAGQALLKDPTVAKCLAPPPTPKPAPTPAPPTPKPGTPTPPPAPPAPAGAKATLTIQSFTSNDCSGTGTAAAGSVGQCTKIESGGTTAYFKFDMKDCKTDGQISICLGSDCKTAAMSSPFKASDYGKCIPRASGVGSSITTCKMKARSLRGNLIATE